VIRFIKSIIEDIDSVFDRDPAARTRVEVLFLYPHIKALIAHRIAATGKLMLSKAL
jgi:serine O-acetyltransferase